MIKKKFKSYIVFVDSEDAVREIYDKEGNRLTLYRRVWKAVKEGRYMPEEWKIPVGNPIKMCTLRYGFARNIYMAE